MIAIEMPRRLRRERGAWNEAARHLDGSAPAYVTAGGFTKRPYLAAHPEREMALQGPGDYPGYQCEACAVAEAFPSIYPTRGDVILKALVAAHRHNAKRHPRRFARSQHLVASIPAAVPERAGVAQ